MISSAVAGIARCLWICVLILTPCPMVVQAAASGEPEPWVDRGLFPEAYSILTSERVMFPDDVSDVPIKIDSCRQLLIDDYLIASLEHLSRQLHQPTKFSDNPLMSMKGAVSAVLYDETSGTFRMYNGANYMESRDGTTWTAPDLGTKDNRVFDPPGELRGLMHDPGSEKPQERYQAVILRRPNPETNEKGGFYLYQSADGLHWTQPFVRPILRSTVIPMNPGAYWAKGIGDTTTFRYDSILQRYICDAKFNLYLPQEKFKMLGIVQDFKPRLRLRTISESEDLIHWTRPRFYLFPDQHDPPSRQMYGHVGFVYESMWIGVLRAMRLGDGGWKQVDLQVTYSRDGRHWSRPRQRQPFIPVGGPDSWEADYLGLAKTGPVLVGDELWFYYFGARNAERDKSDHWSFANGLAKLRRDGFASLNAGATPGQIVTRPLTFKGRSLFLNADVRDTGWVKCAVLSQDSEPVEGYALDEAVPLTNDTTRGAMGWRTRKELVPPGDEHVRLVFQLKDAKLYSFWIE